jgi:hypothetical protein
MSLSFALNSTMLSGCSEFPNNCILIQFLIIKDVFEMFTYV